MSSPCDTCAFKEGSVTRTEPHNLLKGVLSVLTPSLFACHYTTKGADIHKDPTAGNSMTRQEWNERGMQVCQGWREECAELAKTGYYKENPMITKGMGMAAMASMQEFLDSEPGEDKEHARNVMERSIAWLVKKKAKYLKRL